MHISYFKQAWNLIRQEFLFSSIYIIGTGLSITMVMVLSILFYLRVANIYPETYRDRLLAVTVAKVDYGNGSWSMYALAENTIDQCLRSLKTAEAVTAIFESNSDVEFIQPDDRKEQWPVVVKYIDPWFWTVFPFVFKEGKSFTEEEFRSGMATAVIAESLAKKLFSTSQATGQYITLDFLPYRVAGVVKDASYITTRTYANVWIPYTAHPTYEETKKETWEIGPYNAYILAPSVGAVEEVRQEAMGKFNQLDQMKEERDFLTYGQPDRQWQTIFRESSDIPTDFNRILWIYGLILTLFLLVPAISLSGMIDSRMERRMAEIGIRRTFGAPNQTIMKQIISENMLFTLLGGVLGLILSYLFILGGRNWMVDLGQSFVDIPPENTKILFTPAMLLNKSVFGMALLVCFLINILASFIPAWRASRRDIIHSLHAN